MSKDFMSLYEGQLGMVGNDDDGDYAYVGRDAPLRRMGQYGDRGKGLALLQAFADHHGVALSPAQHAPAVFAGEGHRPMRRISAADALYSERIRGRAPTVTASTVFHYEATVVSGDVINIQAAAPQDFVLDSAVAGDGLGMFFRNANLSAGGLPLLGYAGGVAFSRFYINSTDRKLPPVSIKAGTPIILTGTISTPNASEYFLLDLLGMVNPTTALQVAHLI